MPCYGQRALIRRRADESPASSAEPASTVNVPARAGVATALPPPESQGRRLGAVDWLRGLAVVLMIQTHLYDAWAASNAKATTAYTITRFLGGIPARLFMLLVGVSLAIRFEAHLTKATPRRAVIRESAQRGVLMLVLAYVFRVQEYVLGGLGDNWRDVFRVDILNCIGASLIVVPLIAAPLRGRPAYGPALLGAALFLGLGPIVGPARFPGWLPPELTSYLGGQRPLAWFSLFPWAAWPLAGVALGHVWMSAARRGPGSEAKVFLSSGIFGALCTATVIVVRAIDPHVIRYPSEVVQQMGPGAFFYRLGLIGVLAALAWAVVRRTRRPDGRSRFSVMRQLGTTSLLVYWVHVDLCYGLVSKPLHGRLTMSQSTVGFAAMLAAMIGLSLARTHLWGPWWKERRKKLSGVTA